MWSGGADLKVKVRRPVSIFLRIPNGTDVFIFRYTIAFLEFFQGGGAHVSIDTINNTVAQVVLGNEKPSVVSGRIKNRAVVDRAIRYGMNRRSRWCSEVYSKVNGPVLKSIRIIKIARLVVPPDGEHVLAALPILAVPCKIMHMIVLWQGNRQAKRRRCFHIPGHYSLSLRGKQ